MNWERAWLIASALLLIAAAVLLWRNNLPAAFVIAALGACAWFLSYRAQLKEKTAEDETSEEQELSDEVSTASDSDRVREEDD